jgi:hypothetical protein
VSPVQRLIEVVVVVACVVLGAAPARAAPSDAPEADAVALLPLDAERSLEIYGQPVASELARALVAGNVRVVVVGPKMAVPDRARLIIDGKIAQGKTSTVTISLRIRSAFDGTTLEALSATAAGLAKLDGAAAELSARVLPLVRSRLAALRAAEAAPLGRPSADRGVPGARPGAAGADPITLLALTNAAGKVGAPLLEALEAATVSWTRAQHREARKVEVSKLDPKLIGPALAAAGADLAIGIWVTDYDREPGPVAELPVARARVRVQLVGPLGVLFDRVVVTDTVVGDKGSSPSALATRVAREVLAILRPHVRRHVPSWQ